MKIKTILFFVIFSILLTGFVKRGEAGYTKKIDDRIRAKQIAEMKFGMFICWSFSTFSGQEWTPTEGKDASYFKATGCNTDQWCKVAKDAGMGYILFLTKHHDGFCLWDTRTTAKKVTNSPLKIDVLAKLRKSCDKYGIKLALYFSEGDWTFPGAIFSKDGGKNPDIKKAQLKELLTNYGPIEYIWFDHAQGDGGLSHDETDKWVAQFQPNCLPGYNHGTPAGRIRIGEMGSPSALDDISGAGYNKNISGYHGYIAAEFTYPILPEHQGGAMWFYSLPKYDNLCLPAEKILQDYLGAVKYGNIFSVDVGPDWAGNLRGIDVQTLRKVGRMIRNPLLVRVYAPVDWPAFLSRHDIVWDKLPAKFDHGAFLGNGLMGTMIYTDGPNRLRFETGRSDVTDHRRDNGRLPIGGMILKTVGTIKSGSLRMVLWDAEVRGSVITDKGLIRFRAMVHANEMALLIDLETEGGEKDAAFIWEAEKSEVFRDEMKKINALDCEGQKIRYKVVLALFAINTDLFKPRDFERVPLELMHHLLDMVQHEVGYKGYGKEILKGTSRKVRKNGFNPTLDRLYAVVMGWNTPLLFAVRICNTLCHYTSSCC